MKINNSSTQLLTNVKKSLSAVPGKIKQAPKRTIWISAAFVVVLVAAAGFFLWRQNTLVSQETAATLNTSTVRKGDISISASGTGTLVAVLSNDLGFPITGYLGELNVRVGDKVVKDQPLAKLADLTALETNVVAAEQDLITAQQELDDLKLSAPSVLANAQLTVAEDKKAVKEAESGLILPNMIRCDQDETDAYYNTYLLRKDQLDALGETNTSNTEYYLKVVVPAKNLVAQAYSTYEYCAGFTEYELDASRATLALAKAQLEKDQSTLEMLKENDGLDPSDLATAENKVKNAEVAVEEAKQNLDGGILKAPFDGTITEINAQVGDKIEVGSFITIVDDSHPQIEFAIDETDMAKLSMDAVAEVTFDAIENKTFAGKVILINPSLQTTNGYATVKGTIQLELAADEELPVTMQGLTASVNIYQGKSEDTMLIPVQAVREIGNGEYGVYVVDKSGNMTLKTVTVGLMDSVNAEILTGLSVGDTVSTGLVETK